jgi:hypothetical protein
VASPPIVPPTMAPTEGPGLGLEVDVGEVNAGEVVEMAIEELVDVVIHSIGSAKRTQTPAEDSQLKSERTLCDCVDVDHKYVTQ